ncbi:putative ribonuclease H-like domain-containing protein [Tanacetum coccineum]|uniref:Ribonuclease H-like domain-containing protein n=1 Tax=Tanacetum coccineum TaxID=301880 RepID=A0ABQ5BUL5_9ASTR
MATCDMGEVVEVEERFYPGVILGLQGKRMESLDVIKDKKINTARLKEVVNVARPKVVVNAVKGNNVNAVKALACWVWKPKTKVLDHGNPQKDLHDQGVIDSGCSRHMTGNMSYLTEFEEIDGGYVAFRGNPKGRKITGKLTDESHVLLKVPRKNNMYSVDLKNIVPKGGLNCLFAKATSDESELWHRRLGHINFKTMNNLVKGNLVRGLPSKLFENNQTCVAYQKGNQHRASCKYKTVSSISQPLHMLHMDLFGPTFVKSLMKKMYCLVVIDDYSRFSWVFFLATKDETSGILKSFITRVENLIDQRDKVIRCDNGTEFKNKEMNQFCERKGIKREFRVARTLQQNGVAERKNRTLIEATKTMLADSKLPTTFWAKKTSSGFMRPFGCPVTILNIIDHLGKFDGKADEGFFDGYSINSKAFIVFNSRTRIVEENLHVQFSKNTPNILGSGPDWLFDIDALTKSINYKPVIHHSQISKSSPNAGFKPSSDDGKKVDEDSRKDSKCSDQEKEDNVNSTNNVNAASTNKVNAVGGKSSIKLPDDPYMPALKDTIYSDDNEDVGAKADMNNLDASIPVSHIPTTRVHKEHPFKQIIRDLKSAPQTRRMTKNLEEHGLFSPVQQRTNHKDFQNCMFACFLSQEEPKKVIHALKDPSWIEAMQEELLQFKLQEVWTLVKLPNRKRAISNSQVKDNKIDLLVQQYEQFTILEEESIDSGFARFNTIIPSLKALDEAQDALIGNLKVHEVVMEKDYEIYKDKKERVKTIALKAKKDSSDDETLTSRSDDEEYATAIRNFKKFFRIKGKFVRQPRGEKKSFRQRDEKKGKNDRKCFRCGDPNHLIGVVPKPFVTRSNGLHWRFLDAIAITGDVEDKTNDETCLMAQSSNEGRLRCKGVTKQIVGVILKGLALQVFLVDHHSKDESGKGFKPEVN